MADTILINPVGLRYHATHHLFPSMPYHNMRKAHRRLMEKLPADSPYRQTVGTSVWATIANLWQRAAENRRSPNEHRKASRPQPRPIGRPPSERAKSRTLESAGT